MSCRWWELDSGPLQEQPVLDPLELELAAMWVLGYES